MLTPPVIQRRSWFLALTVIAFIITAGFSVYLQVRASSLRNELADLKTQKEKLEAPFSAQNTEETDAASQTLAIKTELQKIETAQLYWSKLAQKIEDLIPKTKNENEPIVSLRSYNGTEDGKLSLNMTTRGGATDPFNDAAMTIRAFATEPSIQKIFVPSVTKSLTPGGETVLSFSINFEYKKQAF